MAAIYTWRIAERPGFMAVLSEDGGRTWDLDNRVRLWAATGWTHLGINAPEVSPHSHDTVAFGAPTLLATLEGDRYASWWCTYAPASRTFAGRGCARSIENGEARREVNTR